jgi:hypothetical protein
VENCGAAAAARRETGLLTMRDDDDRRRGDMTPAVRKAFRILEEAIRQQQRRVRQAKANKTYLQLLKHKKTASLIWLIVSLGS